MDYRLAGFKSAKKYPKLEADILLQKGSKWERVQILKTNDQS